MKVQVHQCPQEIAGLQAPWRALEARALEPNAYLSARFVLPALTYLPAAGPIWILTVWDHPATEACGPVLCGLGVFQSAQPQLRFPFDHTAAYGSVHSFLGGLLLDRQRAHPALHAMLDGLTRRTAGLRLSHFNAQGPTAAVLRSVVTERGASWHEEAPLARACLVPGPDHAKRWRAHVSPARLRKLERQWRKLGEAGHVRWRYLRGHEASDAALERFLALEHAGWKGQEGTSLRSDLRQETFFLRMAQSFREDGELFLTELLFDGEVIASSCNLRSGADGFAFKVAFDPRFSKFGPGLLNEFGFLKALEEGVDEFRSIDSGAAPGSFIEELWPERIPLRVVYIALRPFARTAAMAAECLLRLRHRLMGRSGMRQAAA